MIHRRNGFNKKETVNILPKENSEEMGAAIFLLRDRFAKAPTRKTPNAAGTDLYTIHPESVPAFSHAEIQTGIAVKIPDGHFGKIEAISSMTRETGYIIGAGIVDSDFDGEITIHLINPTSSPIALTEHQRIAQMIIQPYFNERSFVVHNDSPLRYELETARILFGHRGQSGQHAIKEANIIRPTVTHRPSGPMYQNLVPEYTYQSREQAKLLCHAKSYQLRREAEEAAVQKAFQVDKILYEDDPDEQRQGEELRTRPRAQPYPKRRAATSRFVVEKVQVPSTSNLEEQWNDLPIRQQVDVNPQPLDLTNDHQKSTETEDSN